MTIRKAAIFAHLGQVTAISFPGEPMNFTGTLVKEIEAPEDEFEAALTAQAPVGVGSPWPPAETAKPATRRRTAAEE